MLDQANGQVNFGPPLCAAFAVIWAVSVFTGSDALTALLLVNAGLQLILFIGVACIPYLRTGRMSYVDIAWPFGVALIGIQIILLGDGELVRRLVAGSVYLMIGLRMGIGALVMAKATGVIFKTEFPRYVYRRMVLERTGASHIRLHTLAEIMAQGLANMSVLALPGFMLAVNADNSLSGLELTGLCIWAGAYILESTADAQKLHFLSKNRGSVCDVGLWRFSRHPNYFAEWLVWTGLVIAAIPSWIALRESGPVFVWITIGIGALAASAMMYTTLVHLTGAIPAEYYSVRKRPEYRLYQQRTNRFFPWFPREA